MRRHDKARHSHKQRGQKDDHAVGQLAAVQRRDAAQHYADHDCRHHREDTQLRRDGELGPDGLGDLTSRLGGDTEISVKHVAHVDYKLLSYRFIQVKAFLKRRLYFRRLGLLARERSARDRVHRKECDHADYEDGHDREKNSFEYVLCHTLFCSLLLV